MANRGVRDSLSFDKADRVKKHLEAAQLLGGAILPRLRNWSPEGIAVAPPLSTLRPIELRELELDRTHIGRVLYGTLCVKPFKTYFVQTVLEDGNGKAVLLSIYDPHADYTVIYAKGVKVALKEPWLFQYAGGNIGIRVDNPVNVESVRRFPDVPSSAPPPIKVQSKVAADLMDPADFLRTEGNNHYARRDWKKAIECYSHSIKCVEQITSRTGPGAGKNDGDIQADEGNSRSNQLVLGYSNRAETWLQLESYEMALSDSTKALELGTSHEKSFLRKAKSLYGLKRYLEAIECLEGLLALKTATVASQRENIEATLEKARNADKQVRLGVFDLDYYYRSGCSGVPPECRNYVGPVEVRRTQGLHSTGRGLFLTKDVKEGDLLLVSNALAVARVGHSSSAKSKEGSKALSAVLEDLVGQLVGTQNSRTLQQLDALQHTAEPPEGDFPPMALFSDEQVVTESAALPVMDIARIRRIVAKNAIQGNSTLFSFGFKLDHKRVGAEVEKCFVDDGTEAAGLWGLPSLINHSCSPNSAFRNVGEALFINASRDLRKGDEVTCAFYDVFVPLGAREKASELRGFSCLCPRCALERSLLPLVPETVTLARKYYKYFEKLNETKHGLEETFLTRAHYLQKFLGIAPQVENSLKQNAHLAGLGLVKKNWIRASYVFSYLFSTRAVPSLNDLNPHDAVLKPKAVLPADVILKLMFAVHPGCELTMALLPDFLANSAPSKNRIAVRMSERVCKCIYGPLRTETMNTIVGAFQGSIDSMFSRTRD